MLQNVEEAPKLGATAESEENLDEILRRAGVSIPTMRDIEPFQPVRVRPRWLAFIIRLFS